MQAQRPQRGFTLVEMVAVILLLGVVGAATVQYISLSLGAYKDASRRSELVQMGRFAIEKISRESRNALPGSVRTRSSAAFQCLEFVPIRAATGYVGRVSDLPAVSEVALLDFDYSYSIGDQLAIYTIDSSDVYSAGTQALAALDGVTSVAADLRTAQLSSAHRFPQESPLQRAYIVQGPVSYCVEDNRLLRYSGYGRTATQSVPPAVTGVPVASGIRLRNSSGASIDAFRWLPGTLERAGILHLNFNFSADGASDEWLQLSQDVSIRNSQ